MKTHKKQKKIGSRTVLQDLNLQIPAGQATGIVGHLECGGILLADHQRAWEVLQTS